VALAADRSGHRREKALRDGQALLLWAVSSRRERFTLAEANSLDRPALHSGGLI
jgi:hypothetical protein